MGGKCGSRKSGRKYTFYVHLEGKVEDDFIFEIFTPKQGRKGRRRKAETCRPISDWLANRVNTYLPKHD